jgi:predicted nucleic acid-binding Zn ribbon protein
MAEKLVQHRHCQSCLKAVPIGEEYCSDQCKDDWNDLVKANKKKNLMAIVWMVVVVIFAMMLMAILQT